MNMEQLIKETIANTLNIPIEQLNNTTGPGQLQNWDSANHLFLIGALETTFRVTFSIEETMAMINIEEIKKILSAKMISN